MSTEINGNNPLYAEVGAEVASISTSANGDDAKSENDGKTTREEQRD